MFMRIAPDQDRTIACAGIVQSAALVFQMAMTDRYDKQALHHSIHSLLRVDADSTTGVYGSIDGVQLGLETLSTLFKMHQTEQVQDMLNYCVGMHRLAMILVEDWKIADRVMTGIDDIALLYARHYENSDEDEALCERIAELYSQCLSPLRPRIIVKGEGDRLENRQAANRVRAALFAGIRSAFLWHQLGGRRWHVFFARNEYQNRARALTRL